MSSSSKITLRLYSNLNDVICATIPSVESHCRLYDLLLISLKVNVPCPSLPVWRDETSSNIDEGYDDPHLMQISELEPPPQFVGLTRNTRLIARGRQVLTYKGKSVCVPAYEVTGGVISERVVVLQQIHLFAPYTVALTGQKTEKTSKIYILPYYNCHVVLGDTTSALECVQLLLHRTDFKGTLH